MAMVMVVKEEKKDMIDCSEKYILEYGDSKLVIPNEVGPTEDGKSLKVDLKDDADIKKFVGNCQSSEGTYLDQAQEEKEMDESPIKQKPISLKGKPRISPDCVDAVASAAGDLYSSEEEEPNLEEGHQTSDLSLPSAIDTRKSTSVLKTEHVKQSKVYSEVQEIAKISGPVPHIGKTSAIEDGAKDEEEKGEKRERDVLIDVGNESGSDFSSTKKQHNAKVFQWIKMLTVLLFVIDSSAAEFVMFGKMSHVDVNKDIPPSPDENEMNMDQSVKVILHQIQKRSEPVKILTYKILDQGEDCTDGIKRIQEMCQEGERALCVRNNTWKTLVAVCVENITMDGFCPVFTLTINKEKASFYAVQADSEGVCENCSRYGLWDVGKYPQCLQLEIMDTTTIDSNATTTNSSFVTVTPAGKKEVGEGLSVGGKVGIIIGSLALVVIVFLAVLLWKRGCLEKIKQRMGTCRERERENEQEMSDSMIEN